ncbi:MAG: hypothetical protein JWM80_584 [Cyanobacteria bacterium RYN_339]|nr:hypothetical protein [Cyanobacteria bacterium RYN_339]
MYGIDASIYLAMILPILGLIGSVMMWKRWKAPVGAKIVMVIAIFGLLVPATCGGMLFIGDYFKLFKTSPGHW